MTTRQEALHDVATFWAGAVQGGDFSEQTGLSPDQVDALGARDEAAYGWAVEYMTGKLGDMGKKPTRGRKAEDTTARDGLIRQLAEVMAGLAVPVSMDLSLGKAGPAWSALHTELIGFGWATAEQYEAKLREVLGV